MRMKIMTIVKPDKTTIVVATHGDWQVGQLKHQIELDTNNAFVANNFKLVDPNHPFKPLNEYRTLSYYRQDDDRRGHARRLAGGAAQAPDRARHQQRLCGQ